MGHLYKGKYKQNNAFKEQQQATYSVITEKGIQYEKDDKEDKLETFT